MLSMSILFFKKYWVLNIYGFYLFSHFLMCLMWSSPVHVWFFCKMFLHCYYVFKCDAVLLCVYDVFLYAYIVCYCLHCLKCVFLNRVLIIKHVFCVFCLYKLCVFMLIAQCVILCLFWIVFFIFRFFIWASHI